MDPDRLEQLAQVASWYYEENLSLTIIAKRLERSVSMVSRMLQEARDRNLVEIRVRYPVQTDTSLENQLCKAFSINQALVFIGDADSSLALKRMGSLGARFLQQQLRRDTTLGIGWGTSVYTIVSAMPYLRLPKSQVIQVSGAVGASDPTVDGAQMAHWLAQKLDSPSRILHTPLIVKSEIIAQALKEDQTIAETLYLAAQVDIALIGVGIPYLAKAGLRRAGYLTNEDVKTLEESGAVGDIIGFHLGEDGEILDIPLNKRIVGIGPRALLGISNVVVAAHGREKVPVLLASLKKGYINTLVTDSQTAVLLLKGVASV